MEKLYTERAQIVKKRVAKGCVLLIIMIAIYGTLMAL